MRESGEKQEALFFYNPFDSPTNFVDLDLEKTKSHTSKTNISEWKKNILILLLSILTLLRSIVKVMSAKGSKSRSKVEKASDIIQKEKDLQEIQRRTVPLTGEVEVLLREVAHLDNIAPVNDVEEATVLAPSEFVSLLDASHAANRRRASEGILAKTKDPEADRETPGTSHGAVEKPPVTGGALPKATGRGSRSASVDPSSEAKAASQHLAHLMANSQHVTDGFDSYVARVVQAGMRLHDKDASKVWRDCEPVVRDLTSKHSYKVSKILVATLPCSVGEFYNRVMGLSEGISLGISENLRKVEENLGLMVDNLQKRCHDMNKNQEYHDTQMISFASQVGNASAAIAQSVKLVENLAIKMSDAVMKMPFQSKAPTVGSESVGSSVFQPIRKGRAAPEIEEDPYASVGPFLEKMRIQSAVPSLPTEVQTMEVDGTYTLGKIAIRVRDGKIIQITGLRQKPPITLFMGKKAKLLSPIFACPLIALENACRESPGWWVCLEKGGSKSKAKQVIENLFPTPSRPNRWGYSPE